MTPDIQGRSQLAAPGSSGVAVTLEELVALRGTVLGLPRSTPKGTIASPGTHLSVRHGQGMEFAEIRPYQAGDDPRTIDWRHTARRGRLYTKLYHAEHERPVRLLVDLNSTMRFGTRAAFKSVQAARAAACLAWQAVQTGDRVGGIVWTGGEAEEVRPMGRRQGALALLSSVARRSALAPENTSPEPLPLDALLRQMKSGGLNVVISDFASIDDQMEPRIRRLARGSTLVLVHVYDCFESDPPRGLFRLTDGERTHRVDLRTAATRKAYLSDYETRCRKLERMVSANGALLLGLATDESPLPVVSTVSRLVGARSR